MGSVAPLLHMNRLNKTESAIFVSLMCSWLPKDLHSELIDALRKVRHKLSCKVVSPESVPMHHMVDRYATIFTRETTFTEMSIVSVV